MVDEEECSRYFSRFLITFSTSDGPVTAQRSILRTGAVWHPVDLAQPDHTPARGQPSTESARAFVWLCPRAGVW